MLDTTSDAPTAAPGALRVLQVFEPGCDGVFRHVEQLVEFLWRHDIHCDLAFSSSRPSVGLYDLVERVKERGGEAIDLHVGPAPEIGDLRAAARLIALFRRTEPFVVHAHSSKAGGLVRALAPFWGGRPLFYTPNAYYGMNNQGGAMARMYNIIERILAPSATTINVSHDEASFAKLTLHLDTSRCITTANPVDCRKFRPASREDRIAARTQLNLSQESYIIGYASRHTQQKAPQVAYEAFAKFGQTHPDAHLLHLCKGNLLTEARRFVAKHNLEARVTFVDYLEDTRPFYHALDVFLLTSRYEAGWPFVFIEAMACSLPLITSSCPGLSDVSTAGLSHCQVFPVGESAACTAAMQRAYALRDHKPANHRATAQARFSIEHCFGIVLQEYLRTAPGLMAVSSSRNSSEAKERPGQARLFGQNG